MPTNQEWLHKLANESPDELKAWFEAEHVYDMDNAECVHMCPNEANDENQRESGVSGDDAHSNDANAHLKASEDLSDAFSDSLAQLETDVRKQLCDMFGNSQLYESVIEPCIDRAMAMRERDVRNEQKEELEAAHAKNRSLKLHISKMQDGRHGWHLEAEKLQRKVDELTDSYEASSRALEILTLDKAKLATQVDKLQSYVDDATADYAKLVKERDNLADDLLTCNREREHLRKNLGIALDHAHDICALVDIGD